MKELPKLKAFLSQVEAIELTRTDLTDHKKELSDYKIDLFRSALNISKYIDSGRLGAMSYLSDDKREELSILLASSIYELAAIATHVSISPDMLEETIRLKVITESDREL